MKLSLRAIYAAILMMVPTNGNLTPQWVKVVFPTQHFGFKPSKNILAIITSDGGIPYMIEN